MGFVSSIRKINAKKPAPKKAEPALKEIDKASKEADVSEEEEAKEE